MAAIFISNGSIFLRGTRGPPTINPAATPRRNDEQPASVQPRASSEDHLAELHEDEGTSPPSGVYESCIEFTEPFEAAGGVGGQIADEAMPSALLALHVCRGWADERLVDAERGQCGLPLLEAVADENRRDQHDEHRGEQRPPCRRSRTM